MAVTVTEEGGQTVGEMWARGRGDSRQKDEEKEETSYRLATINNVDEPDRIGKSSVRLPRHTAPATAAHTLSLREDST